MQFCIYRLRFTAGVHFGTGTLWDGASTLSADTLFSALCQEALTYGGEEDLEELVSAVRSGLLRLSDLFPFVEEELYLPKPLYPVARERDGDSSVKKAFKKLKFVPVSQWDAYLKGEVNPATAVKGLQALGKFSVRTMVSSRSAEKLDSGDALPYSVGVYQFCPGSGLYLIAGTGTEKLENRLDRLLHSLSFSGLGGKRSAGLGRFTVEKAEAPVSLEARLRGGGTPAMALSVCMAEEGVLENVTEGARYLVSRRSGFIASSNYAPELRRKRDFYAFTAGSCFETRFAGNVFNVGGDGAHPVYRYAAALWMEVESCGPTH